MNTDIVSFCTLLKCLGFNVKSIATCDNESVKNDSKGISVAFTCHKSHLHIEMQMEDVMCSCPSIEEADSSGVWQVSGTSGGVSVPNKDSGSSVLQHLSSRTVDFIKAHFNNMLDMVSKQAAPKKKYTSTPMKNRRPSMGKEVFDDIYIRRQMADFNESIVSSSLTSLNITPPKLFNITRTETPSRYRSLDTLTNIKATDEGIPEPGMLAPTGKHELKNDLARQFKVKLFNIQSDKAVTRQNTYTAQEDLFDCNKRKMSPDPKSEPVRNRMMKVENIARDLLHLVHDVNEILNNRRVPDPDTSGVSIAFDNSKIYSKKLLNDQHLNVPSSHLSLPFSSIPNLTSPSKLIEGVNTNLKRATSVSTPKIPKLTPDTKTVRKDPGIRKTRSSCGPGLPTPTFGKKRETVGSIAGSVGSVAGSYKSLHDRSSIGTAQQKLALAYTSPKQPGNIAISEFQAKRKSNLYSHIKSTIPKPTIQAKKEGK